MAESSDDLPRFVLYDVLRKLASGGMGEIYLARRHGASELCALKILHEHLNKDDDVARRFLREAEVCSLLTHPNIARLIDAGRDAERMYLASEFVAGRDLEAILAGLGRARELMPAELTLHIVLTVLDALEHVHELRAPDGTHPGLVHRDVGFRNVMIAYDGTVKLIDFGLVRARLHDFRTQPGALMGTPRFMSPEQASGEATDRRSDVYSTAVVLFELLTHTPLVRGPAVRDMFAEVLAKPAPLLSSVRGDLPRALDAVLARALDKNVRDRWASAAELASELRRAAGSLVPSPAHAIAELSTLLGRLFAKERAEAEDMIRAAQQAEPAIAATRVAPLPEAVELPPPPPLSPPRRPRRTWLPPALLAVAFLMSAAVIVASREREREVIDAPILSLPTEEVKSPEVRAAARVSDPLSDRPVEPSHAPAIRRTHADAQPKVVQETTPHETGPTEKIAALLELGDTNALIEAEKQLRALASTLDEPARSALASCLDSQITAPSNAAWSASLAKCLARAKR